MSFINASSFANPQSRLMAVGVNLNSRSAITDAQGQVLAYPQTGGMMSPKRTELRAGTRIFRFESASRSPQGVAAGAWWVEQREFETVLNFAQAHELAIGAAMRYLLLVLPEWSDATLLIRARIVRDLLA